MYKNCYVTRGDEWNHYNIHLWTDNGYSVEQFQNYGYRKICVYYIDVKFEGDLAGSITKTAGGREE